MSTKISRRRSQRPRKNHANSTTIGLITTIRREAALIRMSEGVVAEVAARIVTTREQQQVATLK